MTFPRLLAMEQYWREHPPVHLLVAAYLGFKAPVQEPEKPQEWTKETWQNFVRDFALAGGNIG